MAMTMPRLNPNKNGLYDNRCTTLLTDMVHVVRRCSAKWMLEEDLNEPQMNTDNTGLK